MRENFEVADLAADQVRVSGGPFRYVDNPVSAREDLAFLADAGERLASSLDYELTLQNLAELVIARLADYCIVYLLEEGRLARVACSHADPGKQSVLEEFCSTPMDASADMSVGHAVREMQSSLSPDVALSDAFLASIPDERRRSTLTELAPRSCIVVPLIVGGASIGAMTLVRSHSDLRYDTHDLVLVEDIARRAAQAVDHARLHARVRRQELRQQFLSRVSLELSSSLDYATTLVNAANLAVPDIADWCAIDILEEDGRIRRLAVTHIDPAKVELARHMQERYPTDVNALTGVAKVLRTGETEFYPEINDEVLRRSSRDDEHLQMLRDLEIRSAIMVALISRGETMGVIQLVSSKTNHFGIEEVELVEELARRAGTALDNSRLYTSAVRSGERLKELAASLEQQVQERTEDLVRTNEQLQGFTYSVAHDLRQQIRGISTNAGILLADFGANLPADARNSLMRVAGAAKNLSKLTDDLLAYARLGRQDPTPSRIDLSALAEEIVGLLTEAEVLRSHAEVRIAPGLELYGDPAMLRIVIWNLLDNAAKYSAGVASPQIDVGRCEKGVFVRDNGVGFDMRFVHKVFEPFERLHTSGFTGTGIGLANVRRIIEKHGGQVWAESEPGQGATFFFTLG